MNSSNLGFSYEIIREYLLSEGGKVEYHKLIKHFKDALANPENKGMSILTNYSSIQINHLDYFS